MHQSAIICGVLDDVKDSVTKQGKNIRTFVIREEKGLVAVETMQTDKHNAKPGQLVCIRYICSAREWEGRIFSTARLLDLEVLGGSAPAKGRNEEPDFDDRSLPF